MGRIKTILHLFTPSQLVLNTDGANVVRIKDSFMDVTSTSTDLDIIIRVVGDVGDAGTGRPPNQTAVLISRQELKSICLCVNSCVSSICLSPPHLPTITVDYIQILQIH